MSIEELLKGKVILPSLPLIFTRINEAVNNPRMSIADIGKIISEDTGLSARLLKIANSALYGYPTKIETISRAVTVIGTQQLRDLALATVVLKIFKDIPPQLINLELFWQHSLACGIAARILATYHREPNVERFFVAGILHDLGRLILCMKCPAEMSFCIGKVRQEGKLLVAAERECFGFDHALIGSLLVRHWKLPPSLEEAVLHHHAPSQSERNPTDVAIVHWADLAAHLMELGSSGEEAIPPFDPASREKAGIDEGVLSSLINQVDHQFHDALQTILPSGHL